MRYNKAAGRRRYIEYIRKLDDAVLRSSLTSLTQLLVSGGDDVLSNCYQLTRTERMQILANELEERNANQG